MNEAKSSESDSDLSSNSSWTLLDDHSQTSGESNVKDVVQSEDSDVKKTPSTPELIEQLENKSSDSSMSCISVNEDSHTKQPPNSFLAFEEYFQACLSRQEWHDGSDHVEDNVKEQEERRKKRKAETIQVLLMTCSLLVLTGLSLLCILFPQKIDENITQSIEDNFPAIANWDKCDVSETIESLNKSQELMNVVTQSQLLEKIKSELESKAGNACTEDPERELGETTIAEEEEEELEAEELDMSGNTIMVEGPVQKNTLADDEIHDATENQDDSYQESPIVDTPIESKLSGFKEFLSKTNILTILSCVLHNICVFKALKHFYCEQDPRNQDISTAQPPEQANHTQHLEKLTNTEPKVPDVNVTAKVGSKRKVRVSKISRKVTVRETPIKQNRPHHNISEPFHKPLCQESFSFNFETLNPLKEPTQNCFTFHSNNGLSHDRTLRTSKITACPRNCGELDKFKRKSEMFTEQHRKKMKVLKNEFHHELAEAKKRDLEFSARSRRIGAIKENFILRLKQHREKYLEDLRKLKEERQALLRELCSNKHSRTVESKDVAVGNYVVPITGLCAFEEKLKILKDRESKTLCNKPLIKKSVPHFSGFASKSSENKLCSYQSSPCFRIEKLKMEKYVPFHRVYTQDGQKKPDDHDSMENQQNKLAEVRQKYLQKQTEILDEYNRIISDEVNKIEQTGGKLVEPCMSLLDEIILEAVDVVHKKNEVACKGYEPVRKYGTITLAKKKTRAISKATPSSSSNETSNAYLDDITETTETTKKLLKRLDLYTALFEKQANAVKMMEARKAKPEIVPVHTKYLTNKQDPQKCYVEKIVRGH